MLEMRGPVVYVSSLLRQLNFIYHPKGHDTATSVNFNTCALVLGVQGLDENQVF